MCGVVGSGGEHKLGLALWGLARWGHAAAESGLLTAFNVWISEKWSGKLCLDPIYGAVENWMLEDR